MFSFLGPSLSEIFTPLYKEEPLNLYASSLLTVYSPDTVVGKVRKFWNSLASNPAISVEKALETILYNEFDQAVRIAYQKRLTRVHHWVDLINEIKEPQEVPSAIQLTHYRQVIGKELFHSSREALVPAFSAMFKTKKKGSLKVPEEIAIKDHFLEAADTILFAWKFFLKCPEKCRPIHSYIPTQGLLYDSISYRIIKNERRLYEIESMTQMKTPVALIAKIHAYEDFSLMEKKTFKKWVCLLNEHLETPLTRKQGKIRAKDLILLFTEILNAVHIQSSYSVTFPDLIERMILEGSQIFFRDQAHAIWRASLKEGQTIEVNEATYTLGPCLDEKEEKDTFRVFEIQENPHLIVRIPHNPFFSYVHEKVSEKLSWGVRYNGWNEKSAPATHKRVTPFILEEKLTMLKDWEWTSNRETLTKTDKELALILASHLFFMQDHNQTVENFSLQFLGRDKEGVLKSTHLLKASEGNYNLWEAQCHEMARGNLFVLQFLLSSTKIDQHPVALYYREAVQHVLRTGKIDLVSRFIAEVEYDQENYKKHARKLCKKAKQIYKSCIERTEDRLTTLEISFKEGPEFITKVSSFLSIYYENSPLASCLHPSMEEDVIQQLICYYKNGTPPVYPLKNKEYYEEMYALVLQLNRKAEKLGI